MSGAWIDMAADRWCIEPLSHKHDRRRFDCGEPALNSSGIARTFVAVGDEEPQRILGYYSLSVAGIDKANLPVRTAKRFPNYPIPVARLARLAVDRGARVRGLGRIC